MSSQHVFICDRCGVKDAGKTMPNGWSTVTLVALQADLCAQCLSEYREWTMKFMQEKRK